MIVGRRVHETRRAYRARRSLNRRRVVVWRRAVLDTVGAQLLAYAIDHDLIPQPSQE